MSYVADLLKIRREEYMTLLDLINRQIKDSVFRSNWELSCAHESKSHYEEVLQDIDKGLKLINSPMSWKDVFDGHKRQQDMYGAAQRAVDAGYNYLAWNGWVYKLDNSPLVAKKTEIKVEYLI